MTRSQGYPTLLCSICKKFGTRNLFVHVVCMIPWIKIWFCEMVDKIDFHSQCYNVMWGDTSVMKTYLVHHFTKSKVWFEIYVTTCTNGFLVPKFLQILNSEVDSFQLLCHTFHVIKLCLLAAHLTILTTSSQGVTMTPEHLSSWGYRPAWSMMEIFKFMTSSCS